jgi:hypothetical protein
MKFRAGHRPGSPAGVRVGSHWKTPGADQSSGIEIPHQLRHPKSLCVRENGEAGNRCALVRLHGMESQHDPSLNEQAVGLDLLPAHSELEQVKR